MLNLKIDYRAINREALLRLPEMLRYLLPSGRRQGNEWVALNPRRQDHRLGSFKINMVTGRWADFAIGDRGGDIVSLVAYLRRSSQSDAAREVIRILGLRHE